jgi:cation diffusion facilitator family transporter
MNNRYQNLKIAQHAVTLSMLVYIFLAVLKVVIGQFGNSSTLVADGANNITDILSSIAIIYGLHLARRPPDEHHQYGHWKAETIATFTTSLVMMAAGGSVIYSSIKQILTEQKTVPDIYALFVGIFSAIVMYAIYLRNAHLAKKIKSGSLLAIAKDTRNDAWTSIGTSATIIAANFKFAQLDNIVAMVIGGLILKTAYHILADSAFALSDGFDDELLDQYRLAVEQLPQVEKVHSIQGRTYGANIYIDIIIWVDPQMTVRESHHITEKVESLLRRKFNVFDTDVHVEPWDVDYEPLRPDELNSH